MWIGVTAVIAWIIGGLIVTGGDGSLWVIGGAIGLAVCVPTIMYRYAKQLMLRLMFRLDPPEGTS